MDESDGTIPIVDPPTFVDLQYDLSNDKQNRVDDPFLVFSNYFPYEEMNKFIRISLKYSKKIEK